MSQNESEFPTIADLHGRLADLITQGLGELPVQILVVPDSTLQAIARNSGQKNDAKPAIMLDLVSDDGRLVSLISAERLGTIGARTAVQ